ncbi:hypothetical protein [Marinobacter salicampi]|uniref:hypothetical protein n=1 Tax=Marinobacter salicampi TaxID=435907 RepID=UPI00140BD61D|nr:hypothetical protein [Marinobacter salicampi]
MSSDQTAVQPMQNIIDFNALVTEPGGPGPFSPPPGWEGPDDTYRRRIREALLQKRDRHQQLLTLFIWSEKGYSVGFTGPYADSAREVYNDLKAELGKAAA